MRKLTPIQQIFADYANGKYVRVLRHSRGGSTATTGLKEAEQALLALFNEAIGEDEPNVTSLLDNDTAPYIDNPVAIARNQLRAEIRKKVGL